VGKKVRIKSSTLEDVRIISQNLRQDDIYECSAINQTPYIALLNSFIYTDEGYTVTIDDIPVGIFGISKYRVPNKRAIIWFLGTDEMTTIPFFFVREGKKYINRWLQQYDILFNVVSTRNTTHIKWLMCLGAEFSEPLLINNIEFKQFFITKG
jgi:hypothetical protein